MDCVCGLNRATNRSERPWDGQTTKCEAIEPCDDIGNWSVVPSPFAGIITVTLSLIRFDFQRVAGARRLASKNRLLRRSQEAGKKMSDSVASRPLLSWPRVLREPSSIGGLGPHCPHLFRF